MSRSDIICCSICTVVIILVIGCSVMAKLYSDGWFSPITKTKTEITIGGDSTVKNEKMDKIETLEV